MSVVGIDFGNESCVIAIARKGVIEVVDNEVTHRKTPTVVGFQPKERNIGESGYSSLMSNNRHSVTQIKRLIGRSYSHPLVQQDLRRYTCKVIPTEDDNILIETQSSEGVIRLAPEQVYAAMLTRLRQTTEDKLGQRVKDCVLTCPPYYTDAERTALIDAATVAGLNVLRLMNETTAVALNYGILRSLPEKDPIRVVFFDMGHASTNVAVVSFVEGKLTVLGTASDRALGSRDFDDVLIQHFAEEFQSKYKIDVLSNPRAYLRLLKSCDKLKIVLSTNRKVPLNVECIMNDIDASSSMMREEFEAKSESLLARVIGPCEQVLRATNTSLSQVHSIETIGGGSRIPGVRARLEAFFGKALSQTLNGDESVARGAALQCAMISPAFRVREFDVQDVCPYPVELCYGPVNDKYRLNDCPFEDTVEVFSTFNTIPCVKVISFQKSEPFQIVLRYRDYNSIPAGTDRFISRCVLNVPPPSVESDKPPRVKVKIIMDLHGLVGVKSAYLVEDLKELPKEEDEEMAADATSPSESSAQQEPGPEQEEPASEQSPEQEPADSPITHPDEPQSPTSEDMDTSPDNFEGSPKGEEAKTDEGEKSGKSDSKKKAEEKPSKKDKKKRKKTKKTDIPLHILRVGGRSPDELKDFREKEVAMEHQDKLVAETSEKRNELESYVYEIKAKVEYELKEFVTQKTRAKFLEDLDQTIDWLYEDGSDAQKSEYVKRLKTLRKVGDPIIARQWESIHRDSEVGALKATAVKYQMFLQACEEGEEKYSHIEEEDRNKVKTEIDKIEGWIVSSLLKQDRLKKSDNPAITVVECRKKKFELEKLCDPIVTKPKPKPKVEEPKMDESAVPQEPQQEQAAEGGDSAPNPEPEPAVVPPDQAEVDNMEVD